MQRSSLLLQLIAFSNFVVFIKALRTAVPTAPIRCSSREAAELIQSRTVEDGGGLLVITCDASGRGGGSKHDGMASVLRIRHGVALLRRQQTSITDESSSLVEAAILDNTASSHQPAISSGDHDEKEDLIHTTSRRTTPSKTSSEVAAIALGIKHAIKTVPLSLRNKVLILSDSEFALDFYCGERSYDNRQQAKRRRTSNSNKRRGKRQPTTRTAEIREESYWRLFTTLLNETIPGGVIFSKIKSSSRSVGLSTSGKSSTMNGDDTAVDNDIPSSPWDGKGFLDHDASDYLSSNARNISNNNDDEEFNKFPFRAVSRLTPHDLRWLAYSENDNRLGLNGEELSDDDIWNEIIVKGSDARDDRRKRKERRIDSIQQLLTG